MVTHKWPRGFLLCIFLSAVVNKFAQGNGNPVGPKFNMIHRHDLRRNRGNLGVQPLSQLDRLKELLHSDNIRINRISQKLMQKHEAISTYHPACANSSGSSRGRVDSGEMLMNSAADFGTGQYFVHVKVGSPAQKLVLIADTGSDLTWMDCKYRCRDGGCRRNRDHRGVFRADYSSSFRTVPCSSRMCKVELASLFSLVRCPSPMVPCAYDYRYSDGSAALGIFASETVTLSSHRSRRKTRIHNVLVGCTESSRGQSFQAADGVLGLGYSNYSFTARAAERFGNKFSYCLVDHLSPKNITSYLTFGSQGAEPAATSLQYTELVLGVTSPFYAVNIRGISIGGTILEIPSEVWNLNGVGGAVIDSGSSLTFLTQPAYDPVMGALKLSLLSFRNLNLDIGSLEYCFNATGFDESVVPRLAFHFRDGAKFEPPVKSYVIDAAAGVKCLGFVSASWPGVSVIGNIMQQNYLWEFDLDSSRLGFASSSCTHK